MAKKKTVTIEKSSMANCTKFVIAVLLFMALFIIAMIVTFWVKGSVPDTLIQYTLGAGGLEALLLAVIKVSKVFKGRDSK